MEVVVEPLAERVDPGDAVASQRHLEFSHRHLDAVGDRLHRLVALAPLGGDAVQRAAQIVAHAQQILGEARDRVGPRVLDVLLRPPARVLGIGKRAEQLVLERLVAALRLVLVGVIALFGLGGGVSAVVVRLGVSGTSILVLGVACCHRPLRVALFRSRGGFRFRLGPFRLVLHRLLRSPFRPPAPPLRFRHAAAHPSTRPMIAAV